MPATNAAQTCDAATVYLPSPNIVVREIEDELILVPLTSGVGDLEDELYTLNDTGRAVWGKLDGSLTLKSIAAQLEAEFEATAGQIERDVLGLAAELLRRRMIVEAPPGEPAPDAS